MKSKLHQCINQPHFQSLDWKNHYLILSKKRKKSLERTIRLINLESQKISDSLVEELKEPKKVTNQDVQSKEAEIKNLTEKINNQKVKEASNKVVESEFQHPLPQTYPPLGSKQS